VTTSDGIDINELLGKLLLHVMSSDSLMKFYDQDSEEWKSLRRERDGFALVLEFIRKEYNV